jgi:hypothetical protein
VPPLPRNYVERPDALAKLRALVITEGGGPSIAATALAGMGGIGKTVLAQALCRDEVVQQAFPDGIAWVTAGKESKRDLVTRLREVGKVLSSDLTGYDSEQGCINSYRTALKETAALIVVDDVWSVDDLEPFLAESPRSRLLFTTRDDSIAAAVGADVHAAGLLSEKQSWEILTRWSGWKSDQWPAEAYEIINHCGRLPLALAMIGAMLRNKPPEYWKYVLNLLQTADLAKIKMHLPNYDHDGMVRAIQVSVDDLDPQEHDRYLALAVTIEAMPIAPAIQQVLWDADEWNALATAEHFVSRSLAQRDETSGAIRLHDLQLDYVRAHYPDKDALKLINGAVRLSSYVIEKDPRQFAPQMLGRLLYLACPPPVQQFATSLAAAVRHPWLRPLKPTLDPLGTALLRTLEGHAARVARVTITADGKLAVSASFDTTLKVWDLDTSRALRTLHGHAKAVSAVAFTYDGLYVISA